MKQNVLILLIVISFGFIVNAQNEHCTISSCGLTVSCNDYPKILTYTEAVNSCPAGYRLPSIEELECMAKNKSTLKISLWGEYWSLTEVKKNGKFYSITMDDGKREECDKNEKKRVRYIKDDSYKSDETATSDQVLQKWQLPITNSDGNYVLLHLYRPKNFVGSAVNYNVDLEDKEDVWRCKNGTRKTIKITKEGPITLHAKTEAHANLTFDVEFGKEYYVEFKLRMGAFVGVPIFVLQDNTEEIRAEFNKIKEKNDDTE